MSDKGLISKIYKVYNNTIKSGQRIWIDSFQRRHSDDQQAYRVLNITLREMQIKPQWEVASHLFEWLLPKRQKSVSKDAEKMNPWTLLVELYTGTTTMENNMEDPQKFKNRTAIWSSNSFSG